MVAYKVRWEPANHGRPADQKIKTEKHMPRLKRTASKVIQNASARAAGIESIDPALDLGNGMSLAAYKAVIEDARVKQAAYNTLLSQADEAKNVFETTEESAKDFSERILAAIAARYGRDSNEYEQAGGSRKSERRRAVRAVKEPEAITKAA